jgi:hypothetical protein
MLPRYAWTDDTWYQIQPMGLREIMLANFLVAVPRLLLSLLPKHALLAAVRSWNGCSVFRSMPVVLHTRKNILHIILVALLVLLRISVDVCAKLRGILIFRGSIP